MICAGIDAGSRTLKVVLLDADRDMVLGQALTDQGLDMGRRVADLMDRVLDQAGLSSREVQQVVATGYGRQRVDLAHKTVTEITCHAVGVHHLLKDTRTIIDIGGEDSKLIRLDSAGRVHDFVMNDRCAAGTGRFLEVVARRLQEDLHDLGQWAEVGVQPARISSMCVVFAETEIIGLLAAGTSSQAIAAGVQGAIASRVAAMAGRGVDSPVVFTGGVALVAGMREALENVLARGVVVAPDPQFTGALGAAILASGDRQGEAHIRSDGL